MTTTDQGAGAEEPTAAGSGVSDFGISLGAVDALIPGEDELDEMELARRRLAAATRRVIRSTVAAEFEVVELHEAAAQMEALASSMDAGELSARRSRPHPDPAKRAQEFFPTSPVIGFANPLAPPVHVEVVDRAIVGTAWFDWQYEGPPTCVHGGVIALVFDELLGAANIVAGMPGMTGTLSVRYRRPTPLRRTLRLEARTLGCEGRKIRTWGGIFDDADASEASTPTAEAEGIFIALGAKRFVSVITQHASSDDERAAAAAMIGEYP